MRTLLSFLSRHLAYSLMVGIAVAVVALLVFDSTGTPSRKEAEFVPHVLCTSGSIVIKRKDSTTTV